MLAGKLSFVTGGGSGIGRAACQLLAREGAKVVVADVSDAKEDTLGMLGGKDHLSVRVDVSCEDSVNAALNKVTKHYGHPPSIIVNSAGILRDNFLLNVPLADFKRVLDVNLTGTFLVTKAACKELVDTKLSGSIVNIASIVGVTGNLGQSNYSASKAGVEAFTKTVAKEMGRNGIRCNAVVPGFIVSPMTDTVPDKVKDMFKKSIALGRLGNPEEVAEVIVFLASDKSSYVNGASIHVTGGL